jgi:hypothetical protein
VVAATACTWTVGAGVPTWVTVVSAASGGTGDVILNVAENPGSSERSAAFTVAGQPFAITQAGKPCSVALTSTSAAPGEFGGPASFNFTLSALGCSPPVMSYAGWAKVVSTSINNLSGTVNYTVDPNPGLARSGAIAVGEQNFAINQAASTCTYALSLYSASFGSAGGNGSVPIVSSSGACSYPSVTASPIGQIIPGSLGGVAPNLSQAYNVLPFASVTPFIRNLQLLIGGQAFTVKQRSW